MKIILHLFLCFMLVFLCIFELKATTPKVLSINDRIEFNIEIAKKEEELKKGLMFRRFLSPNEGMLFDFSQAKKVSMWMKNTYIPLDMLFIDEAKKIVFIAKDTKPHSLELIRYDYPVRYVLEINAGVSDKLGIKPGDKVEIKE